MLRKLHHKCCARTLGARRLAIKVATFIMELGGVVRIFDTAHGKVIRLQFPRPNTEGGEHAPACETTAFSIVFKDDDFHISTEHWKRRQRSNFEWPEKPFHVIASDVVRFPSESISFDFLQ